MRMRRQHLQLTMHPAAAIILLCISSCSCSNSRYFNYASLRHDLRLVKLAVICRHGDRSPFTTYPSDPYPPNDLRYWPDGPDQLTIKGKKRMLDLGKFIRKQYSDFLSHNPLEVYARSSPADRCLNSAALVLSGAYPPTGRLVIDRSLNWQPIAIHSEKDGLERMLNTPSRMSCPAIGTGKDLQQDASDVRQYEHVNHQFMQQLQNCSGSVILRLKDVYGVYDSLSAAKADGKQLPHWADTEFMLKMKEMNDKIFCVNSSTPVINRLEAGLFLHELQQKFLNQTGHRKMFVYATHDTRMASLLRILNGYEAGLPPYGAALFFELLECSETNELMIRVRYMSDTGSHKIRVLTPSGCDVGRECSVKAFFDGIKDFIVVEKDHEAKCRVVPFLSQVTGCFP